MKTSITLKTRTAMAGMLIAASFVVRTMAEDLYVPADYPTIQAAVDAAFSGDTIHIAAGHYYEQILIADKGELTLVGETGAAIHATSSMTQTLRPWTAARAVLGILRSEVRIEGLTFDGDSLATTSPGSVIGIFYAGSSGQLSNCIVRGFRGPTLTAYSNARGLNIWNPESMLTGAVTVNVFDSTFQNNEISIVLVGDDRFNPTLLRTRFTFAGNTITGFGPTVLSVGGIFIGTGAGGVVRGNTISDHALAGAGESWASGIVAYDGYGLGRNPPRFVPLQPMRFESNTFSNNDDHLVLIGANDSQIVNNIFHGSGALASVAGFSASRHSTIVETRAGGQNLSYYAETVGDWLDSTLKSAARGVTPGIGSRFATGDGSAFTVSPMLEEGAIYAVEITHGNSVNIPTDLNVAIAITGATGLRDETTKFSLSGFNTWEFIGFMTNDPGVTMPEVTFTKLPGASGTGQGFYADAVRFTKFVPCPTGLCQPPRWGAAALFGTNVTIANNDFSDLDTAILLFANAHFLSGWPAIPVATEISLSANWFCNVARPLRVQSIDTVLQELGTKQCPFQPVLQSITQAAALTFRSWHGQPVVLEASTNLQHWAPIHTNSPALPTSEYQDASAAGLPQRFYRALAP